MGATSTVEKPQEELSLIEFIESDESLDADLGEMDPLLVIDFLVEQNKKLWNEKIKFENVSLFKCFYTDMMMYWLFM